jgi:hypothetical protein
MKFQEWIDFVFPWEAVSNTQEDAMCQAWFHAKRDCKHAATMTDQQIRLVAGELTPDEMRAVQAVMAYVRRKIDE